MPAILHTNQATRKATVTDTTTSEGWWAPMAMLDQATTAAASNAAMPQTGAAKKTSAANPKAVAVCPEGKELWEGTPMSRRPSW